MSLPADEAQVAAAVAEAHAAGTPLSLIGNGSKVGLLRPVQAARTLSTAALSGITLYSPQELVISAGAGTPVAELEAAVAARGQQVISEPPDYRALLGADTPQTLGGMVASGLSGPRRVALGAVRDHVLGVRAVNGTGQVLRAGGRVLKNVTGLDLCKLLTGSFGTLAVMTEITLKVLPRPERRASLAIPGLSPGAAVAAMAAGLGSPFGVTGAAWVPALDGVGRNVALLRLEDFDDFVTYRAGRLRETLAPWGDVLLLDEADSDAAWAGVRDAAPLAGTQGAVWRVLVRPSAGARVGEAVARAFPATWFMDWGGGLVWIAGPAEAQAHAAVAQAAEREGGQWTLFRAPEPMRAAVPVLTPEAPALAAISARVKAAFDPAGILNPGRMQAGR